MLSQCPKCSLSKSTGPMGSVLPQCQCDWKLPTAQPEQEPVQWGVDWGKAGDIPCVSIIKRLPDGGIKVLAVEYAPYSYTTSPKQEPVRIMGFNCKCGRRMEVSAEQGVVPAPQRTWVRLTVDEIETIWRKVEAGDFHDCVLPFAEKLEARLKEKNT